MGEADELLAYLQDEVVARRQEGCDTWEIEREVSLLKDGGVQGALARLRSLCDVLERLEPGGDFPYAEPGDLEAIRRERPDGPRSLGTGVSLEVLADKTLGGWTGRVAGCMLGKPVEGARRAQIVDALAACGHCPLADYFPSSETVGWERFGLRRPGPSVLRNGITRGVRDDDTDYTIVGLRIMEAHGKGFTPADVARFWLGHLPYDRTYTAERVAYRNLVNGIWPPRSASWRNPYREWIGAQIRADAWGYACPGRPQEAASLAFRDASISHTRNGIYGEMWVAAMIAAAFVANEPEQVIRIGLSEVPRNCRLAEAIENVLSWCRADREPEQTTERILERYGHYHPVHTINNAAIVAMALMWGKSDFTRSICLAVMAGLDADCNGATVGSVVGTMIGALAIPGHWKDPLNDHLESLIAGDTDARISDLAGRTLKLQSLRADE